MTLAVDPGMESPSPTTRGVGAAGCTCLGRGCAVAAPARAASRRRRVLAARPRTIGRCGELGGDTFTNTPGRARGTSSALARCRVLPFLTRCLRAPCWARRLRCRSSAYWWRRSASCCERHLLAVVRTSSGNVCSSSPSDRDDALRPAKRLALAALVSVTEASGSWTWDRDGTSETASLGTDRVVACGTPSEREDLWCLGCLRDITPALNAGLPHTACAHKASAGAGNQAPESHR